MSEVPFDLPDGTPVDSIVADILDDTADVQFMAEDVLNSLPVTDPSIPGLSSDIEATLDFANSGGSTISDLTNAVLDGDEFDPNDVDATQHIIDRSHMIDAWGDWQEVDAEINE